MSASNGWKERQRAPERPSLHINQMINSLVEVVRTLKREWAIPSCSIRQTEMESDERWIWWKRTKKPPWTRKDSFEILKTHYRRWERWWLSNDAKSYTYGGYREGMFVWRYCVAGALDEITQFSNARSFVKQIEKKRGAEEKAITYSHKSSWNVFTFWTVSPVVDFGAAFCYFTMNDAQARYRLLRHSTWRHS